MNDLRTWWNALDPYWNRALKIKLNQTLESNKAARDAYTPTDSDLIELRFAEGQALHYESSTHNLYDDIEISYFKTQNGRTLRWDTYSQEMNNWKIYMEAITD